MKNIYEIMKSFGLEVPDDKKEAFDKAVNENYKTIKEFEGNQRKLADAEKERDTYKSKYDIDIKKRDEDLATLSPNTKYDIARMKGLGEMDAEELNETTMDIHKRVLRQITVDDTIAADEVFSKLMGEEVEPRREFIETNATYVENLDV